MHKEILLPTDANAFPFYPGSVVLITAVDKEGKADICTVGAWAMVNGAPFMFGIAMCQREAGDYYRRRYTSRCIDETNEFVINIPHRGLRTAWNTCGSVSLTKEPEVDKFELAGLTRAEPSKVKAPLIAECPINIECRVHGRMVLPTHDWIVGEPVACHVAKGILDGTVFMRWEPAARLVPQE